MCLMPNYAIKDKTTKKVKFLGAKCLQGSFPVPCGECLECQQQASLEWTYRIIDESKNYKDNCVITLTYSDDNLIDPSLNVRDYQLFLKRLRRYLEPLKVRYFLSGEYGSRADRKHYHLILFGWSPPDLKYFKISKRGNAVYVSDILSKLWGKGFISVAPLTFETAKYSAKYLQKLNYKNYVDKKLLPPFVRMSLKPGLGYNQALNADFENDKIYQFGKSFKLPRYYLKVGESTLGLCLDDLKDHREFKANLCEISPEKLALKREHAYDFLYKRK